MKNINLYRKSSGRIDSLERGSAQRLDFPNGLIFLKDVPHAEGFYSYTVVNGRGDIVETGSANNLKELRQAAKEVKNTKRC